MGMLSGLNLSRSVARVVAPESAGRMPTGLPRRMLFVLGAFAVGSRFGHPGLLGSFVGVLTGFIAVIAFRVRAVPHG